MLNFKELTPHQIAAYNIGRIDVNNHFQASKEYELEANFTKDKKRKEYLFAQAAMRDSKARELLEKLEKRVSLMKEANEEQIKALFNLSIVSGRTIHHYSWWKIWTSNFC